MNKRLEGIFYDKKKEAYIFPSGREIKVYRGDKAVQDDWQYSLENDQFLKQHHLERPPSVQLELIDTLQVC